LAKQTLVFVRNQIGLAVTSVSFQGASILDASISRKDANGFRDFILLARSDTQVVHCHAPKNQIEQAKPLLQLLVSSHILVVTRAF
jgi:hypothetical protein